ncbi:MAG TPA: Trk system potassium transporter TrkA, partial [Candidatus Hydrogenedentes bacterium]|nr:Trk system potassium transporter TrkA [Candidatus Hydrogenedentota bacterium]
MNIFIAGGGRVGFHLARLLSGERQDVTVIENDPARLEEIDYALDVSTVAGDGSSVMLQQSLNVGAAGLFVASMGNDETNLIAAATAKGLGAKQVVARVDNPMYIESHILYETILGLDFVLSPDALAALEIANYIENPGTTAAEDFGRGLVHMRQIQATKTPTRNGKLLQDVLPPGGGVLLGVINRDGNAFIPHGDAVVQVGDLVTLIGHRDKLGAVQQMFQDTDAGPRKVAILGGSKIGLHLAQALQGKMKAVKLFERRLDRSNVLATKLKKTKVVCRDAVSRVSLEQEHIDGFDVFVAATGDDERNILACVLAKEVGAKEVVAVVHQPDFAQLVQRLDIDLAVTPRTAISNRIVKLVHQGAMTSLAVIGEGQVEVMELTLHDGASVLGKQLKDLKAKFPRGALVASILRDKRVIV